MEEFLNRVEELKALEAFHDEPGGGLALMYGRRRVGKTRLLREFCRGKSNLYYPATTEAEAGQVARFVEFLRQFGVPLPPATFNSWPQVLEYSLSTIADMKEPTVVIFDEFQDVLSVNKSVPSLLRNFWDEAGQFSKMSLVLCGSLMSEMQRLNEGKEPLYGRFRAIMQIKPLTFSQARIFLPRLSLDRQAEMYCVFGGMPAYLDMASRYKSTVEATRRLILDPASVLYEEVPLILGQELREPANYMSIMESIARGLNRPAQIKSVTGISSASLPGYLAQLQAMGLLERDVPAIEKGPEKTKKSIYVIKDNLVRFWYRFLFPNKYLIEEGDAEAVLALIKRDLPTYFGRATEQVWREGLRCANRKDQLPLKLMKTGRYWAGDLEIDICGMGEELGSFLWGECEWRNRRMDIGDLYGLVDKVKQSRVNPDGDNRYILCSKSGFTERLKELGSELGAVLWSLDELDEALHL